MSLNSIILEGIIESIKNVVIDIDYEETQLVAAFYSDKVKMEIVCRRNIAKTIASLKPPLYCRVVGRIESDQHGVYVMAEHIEVLVSPIGNVVKTPNIVKWKVREKQSSFEF